MRPGAARRIAVWAVAALVAAAALSVGAYRLAAHALRSQVIAALGPQAEVDAVRLRAGSVVIEGLRVKAPAGWPAPLVLSARQVVVVPALRTLLSDRPRIARLELDAAYLSVLRTGDGRLQVLPGVLGRAGTPGASVTPAGQAGGPGAGAKAPPGAPPRALLPAAPDGARAAASASSAFAIARIELRGGTLDYFDGSVRRTPHRIRIEDLDATLTDLDLPSLAGRSGLRLAGTVKAAPRQPAARDGSLSIEGWIGIAARDAAIVARLREVDLVALQPYLVRAADVGVGAGTLDLDLNATVQAARLKAPGTLTLAGLALAPGAGGTVLGLPREAVLALLQGRQGRIRVDFVLQGRLDDPSFSISEDLSVRAAAAIAESLGISLEGLVRGVGGVGRKGAEGVVDTLRGLFGR